jgi:lipopolysaccharide transport system ATP-binding protein
MKPILEVKGISKKFSINKENQRYLSLRDSLMNTFRPKSLLEDFWALKDVTFNIGEGESIGIIGRNGAGKSTLLKILSKITPPTSGKIISRGRIASLLEVGTGFHPELTGKENIFLNGAILGMKQHEIIKKFDAIVEFSGIEKFLNTPLKRYSSGMQLRLAFAVAAFLEPEVLVIDEVLAVGDSEFQKKCMGKMDEVSKSGRTVIFVSHNMGVMQQLCKKIVLLNHGTLLEFDSSEKVIKTYLQLGQEDHFIKNRTKENKRQYINSIELKDINHNSTVIFGHKHPIQILVKCISREIVPNARLGIILFDTFNRKIFTIEKEVPNHIGTVYFNVTVPGEFLTPGNYFLKSALHVPNLEMLDSLEDNINFEIIDEGSNFSIYAGTDIGCVFVNSNWEIRLDN